jgi:2-keto-4-pentenoate hydratase
MVADFGCHAGLFIGPRRATPGQDLLTLSTVEVVLCCEGIEVALGVGNDVLGGPAKAIEVLLSSPGARAIAAGEVVTTGALTRGAHSASSGQTWTASTSGSGTLDSIKLLLV